LKKEKFTSLLKNEKLKTLEVGFYVRNYQNDEIEKKKEIKQGEFEVKSPLTKLYDKVEMKKKFLLQRRNLSLSNSKVEHLKLPEVGSAFKADHIRNQTIFLPPKASASTSKAPFSVQSTRTSTCTRLCTNRS